MNSEIASIVKFETRVRQLILAYNELKNEKLILQEKVKAQEEEITQLKAMLEGAKEKYGDLKIARMLEISNSDMEDAKHRITRLMQQVNKCINILKEAND